MFFYTENKVVIQQKATTAAHIASKTATHPALNLLLSPSLLLFLEILHENNNFYWFFLFLTEWIANEYAGQTPEHREMWCRQRKHRDQQQDSSGNNTCNSILCFSFWFNSAERIFVFSLMVVVEDKHFLLRKFDCKLKLLTWDYDGKLTQFLMIFIFRIFSGAECIQSFSFATHTVKHIFI